MAGIDDLRPLDAAIDEIRLLHGAAERAADRIGAEVQRLPSREPGTEGLVADVADALVERTEAIREDCRRLERLLERARTAISDELGSSPQAPAQRAAPARHAAPVQRSAPPPAAVVSPPGPVVPNESFEAPHRGEGDDEPSGPLRFFRRRRGRGDSSGGTARPPSRLPRPDFLAAGVEPATEARDRRPPSQPPVPEGVRLIATQMAIAGASRVEVERRLERQFGIIDASAALDEIYGYTSSTLPE